MLKFFANGGAPAGAGSAIAGDHLAVAAVVTVVAFVLAAALSLDAQFVLRSAVTAGIALSVSAAMMRRHLPTPTLGAANRVTLLRVGSLALLVACVGEPAAAWAVFTIAAIALALDGVDGWLARRDGSATAFGARFDMETDAASLIALTVLVWQFGKAGAWILLAAALRYAFVAAAHYVARLRRPLAPSFRRKSVFVVQAIALVLCLAPPIVPPLSTALALTGLLLLVLSFAIDVLALLGGGRGFSERSLT
jgi:phosphatidylglycerophosphate synthase